MKLKRNSQSILNKEIDNEKVKKVSLYLLAFFIPVFILIRNIYIFKSVSIW